MDDERFKNIATDPRFRPLPSRFRKVKIDDRFKGMFTEKKFKVKCSVDERGRPVKLSSNKHLKKFYELSSSEEEVSDEDEGSEKSDSDAEVELEETTPVEKETKIPVDKQKTVSQKASKERKRKKKRADDKSIQESEDEDEDESAMVKRKEITPMEDFARGIVMMSSSSSEDEDDDEFAVPYDQEAHDDHYWGEHDRDAESTEEITNRLAIQNMDWDRIKAYDLFMLLNSFKPSSGTVHNVKIYPSEYGKEKMAQDDVSGPKELRNAKLNKDGEADGKMKSLSEKDQKRAMLENLRQYQLNRLKYYYAIAEFDSPETANYIYTNCDGREYLASCTQLDLRFVPEDMEFDENEVKDSANHVPDNYEPRFFINPALGQSLVRCTWDENAPDRYDMLNKKYKPEDLEQVDIDNYLASESDEEEEAETASSKKNKKVKSKPTKSEGPEASLPLVASDGSDESEEADEKSIAKYRALLLGGTDNSKDEENSESDDAVDMEITWDTGLKDTAEDMVKKSKSKKVKDGELSVFERKREEKREKAKLAKKAQKLLDRQTKEAAKSSSKSAKFDLEDEDSLDEQAFSDDDIPDGFDQGSDLEPEEALGKKGRKNKKQSKKTKTDSKAEDEEDAGLDLMLMAGTDGSKAKKHFNIKEIAEYDNMTKSKRKRKLKKKQLKEIEDDFQIDVKDERFSALYSSHLYNIDPSSQVYRKTKAMDAIVEEKQRRIRENERTIDKPKKRKLDTSGLASDSNKQTKLSSNNMSSLVKSVKAKTKLHTGKHGARS